MQIRIFPLIHGIHKTTQETEDKINEWLNSNGGYIHHVLVTNETEDTYPMLIIFHDINDKYSNLEGAIRGER
jgi:hypothetical protein